MKSDIEFKQLNERLTNISSTFSNRILKLEEQIIAKQSFHEKVNFILINKKKGKI